MARDETLSPETCEAENQGGADGGIGKILGGTDDSRQVREIY